MSPMKACFGQCANMSIRYRNVSKEHFLFVDEEKLKECDACELFSRCMFLKYNDHIRELLKLIDHAGKDPRPRIG